MCHFVSYTIGGEEWEWWGVARLCQSCCTSIPSETGKKRKANPLGSACVAFPNSVTSPASDRFKQERLFWTSMSWLLDKRAAHYEPKHQAGVRRRLEASDRPMSLRLCLIDLKKRQKGTRLSAYTQVSSSTLQAETTELNVFVNLSHFLHPVRMCKESGGPERLLIVSLYSWHFNLLSFKKE